MARRSQRLVEVLLVFGRLGLTAFGGPAAHVALQEEECVLVPAATGGPFEAALAAAAGLAVWALGVPGTAVMAAAAGAGLVRSVL